MSIMNAPGRAAMSGGSMMDRIMGVIQLKAPVYREIADDASATTQAGMIVVVVLLIGNFFSHIVSTNSNGTTSISIVGAIVGAIVLTILGLIGWVVGAWILAFVAKQFGGKTDVNEMLRVTGFVHIFNLVDVLGVLAVVPAVGCITGLIGFVAAILRLIGYVIGVREAAEFSTTNAIITAVIAIVVEAIIVLVIGGAIFAAVAVAMGVGAAVGGSGG